MMIHLREGFEEEFVGGLRAVEDVGAGSRFAFDEARGSGWAGAVVGHLYA